MAGRPATAAQLLLMVAAIAVVAPALAGSADPDTSGTLPGRLHVAQYQASVFSYHETGNILWLAGPAGVIRLEVRRGRDERPLDSMLAQTGEGWTAVLGGEGAGTINAWDEAWRVPPVGLQDAVQTVVGALEAGPGRVDDSPAGPWRSRPGRSSVVRVRIGSLVSSDPETGFRHRLSGRGLGRGGDDEMLELVWLETELDAHPRLQVRSTRRPGRLVLAADQERPVVYAMPEAFVPLWPLGQLVEILSE